MLRATDEELLARLGRWYVPRREPRYLRRNALVVVRQHGPAHGSVVAEVLGAHLDGADDLLVAHAAWAAMRWAAASCCTWAGVRHRPAIVEELDAGRDHRNAARMCRR